MSWRCPIYGDRNSGWQKIWYYFQDLWSSAFLCVSPASALRAVQATKNACLNPPNLYFFDSQISFLETVQKKKLCRRRQLAVGQTLRCTKPPKEGVNRLLFERSFGSTIFTQKKLFFLTQKSRSFWTNFLHFLGHVFSTCWATFFSTCWGTFFQPFGPLFFVFWGNFFSAFCCALLI